ncbi:MAG TPA: transglutaminase family protein, partial [Chitinivibrionales bacterium]
NISRECFIRFKYKKSRDISQYDSALCRAADSLKEVLGVKAGTLEGAEAIVNVVYDKWGIRFDPCDTVLETLLPALVFERKQGACLGVSLIILTLAQRIQCPIFGVILPGHFFCRYTSGAYRRNIEPNLAGVDHPDEYYRQKYLSSNTPGYDLGNMSAAAAVGVLYYNLGAHYLIRGNPGAAVACFKETVRRIPGFLEAKGNLALAWRQCGNRDSARVQLEGLFVAHPDLVHCAENYGLAIAEDGDFRKAIAVFQKGLEYFPKDTALLRGLAQAYRGNSHVP